MAAITYLSAVVTVAACLIYQRLIAETGARNTRLVTLLIVPIAVLLGSTPRVEALPLTPYLGFALIAAGLMVINGRFFRRG